MHPEDRRNALVAIGTGLLGGLGIGLATMAGPQKFPSVSPAIWDLAFYGGIGLVLFAIGWTIYEYVLRPRFGGKFKLDPFLVAAITAALVLCLSLVAFAVRTGNASRDQTSDPIKKVPSATYVVNGEVGSAYNANPEPMAAVAYYGTFASTGSRLRVFLDLWEGPSPSKGPRYQRRELAAFKDYVRGQRIHVAIVTRVGDSPSTWAFTWGKSNDQIADRFRIQRYLARITLLDDGGVEQHQYFMMISDRINGLEYPGVIPVEQLRFADQWEQEETNSR